MKLVSWNVNSIRVRLDCLLSFLREHNPDCVCLQELKCREEDFPFDEISSLGYNVALLGQKSYNGVAILSKSPIEDVVKNIPGYSDTSSRYIESLVSYKDVSVRVVCLYLPNGNPRPGVKFDYKMEWFDAFIERVKLLLSYEEILVLAGDYNVIPFRDDVYDSSLWVDDALYCLPARRAYRRLLSCGVYDAYMLADGRGGQYSYWGYQKNDWAHNRGLRIDHIVLSPLGADRLENFKIHREMREVEKPSDHVPVEINLSL